MAKTMNVLDPGHIYDLQHLEGPGAEQLIFEKRNSGALDRGNDEYHGTYSQEVIRALIDRTQYLDSVLHDEANDFIVKNLRRALWWYEVRAYRRHTLGINGTGEVDPGTRLSIPFRSFEVEKLAIREEDKHIDLEKLPSSQRKKKEGEIIA